MKVYIDRMSELVGFIYVLLAGLGFGFLGVFGRLGFQRGLSVGEILTWRFLLAALLLWIYLLLFKRKLINLSKKQIFISSALGVFGYSLFSTLYFMSIQGISISLAALLLFTFPIFVNIGAYIFLKEKMTLKQIISLVLATLGIAILVWGPLFINSFSAVIYALLAAISYAIYVLVSGQVQKGVEPLSSSLYVITSAGIALLLFHQPSFSRFMHFSYQEHLIFLGLATICTVAPLTLFLAGLQRLSSSKASLVVMIEPVVAAVAAWLLLDEKLTLGQAAGALLVLLSLFLNATKSKS